MLNQQQKDNAELLKYLNYILQKFIEVRDRLRQMEVLLREQKEMRPEERDK